MNIAREENQWENALSKLASSALPSEKETIYVEEKLLSSLDQPRVNAVHDLADWRQPILDYILNDKVPDDKHKPVLWFTKLGIIVSLTTSFIDGL